MSLGLAMPVTNPRINPAPRSDVAAQTAAARTNLADCELIHPSPDRRDWRRWLKRTGQYSGLNIACGKVFDTLEQGNLAAISGHGISVGDLLLSLEAVKNGLLVLPFTEAVATGDGYYMVWPRNTRRKKNIDLLYYWLNDSAPTLPEQGLSFLSENRHR